MGQAKQRGTFEQRAAAAIARDQAAALAREEAQERERIAEKERRAALPPRERRRIETLDRRMGSLALGLAVSAASLGYIERKK